MQQAAEGIVASIGVKQAQKTLRAALAMGADRAILVVAADDVHQDIEQLAVAKILKGVAWSTSTSRTATIPSTMQNSEDFAAEPYFLIY